MRVRVTDDEGIRSVAVLPIGDEFAGCFGDGFVKVAIAGFAMTRYLNAVFGLSCCAIVSRAENFCG